MDTILLIPIYQPNEASLRFLSSIDTSSYLKVIVIDDGSGTKYKETFDKIRAINNIEVISYPINHGKGHALKVGFNEVQNHYPQAKNVVTADGDGQHLAKDIMTVAKEGEEHPENFYLGSRDFSSPNVPKKSRFGNRFFRLLFSYYEQKENKRYPNGPKKLSFFVPRYLNLHGRRTI
jgi:glycosyltransferase involved in cell wall biosynthesis